MDRLPDRLADGPRVPGAVRAQAERAIRLAGAGRDLLFRPPRLPPQVADGPPGPARPAVVRDLGDLLQPGQHRGQRAAHLPAAALPAGADDLGRVPRRRGGAETIDAHGVACGRRCVSSRLSHRPEHRGLGSHRRRVRRRDRGRPPRPRAGHLEQLPLRQQLRRHLRAVQLLRVPPVRARLRVEWPLGQPAGGARRRDHLRSGDGVRPVRARPPAAPGARRHPARRGPRIRLGRLPVHRLRAAVELQRRPGGRAPGLGPRGLRVAGEASRAARPLDRDEVRAPPAGADVRRRRSRPADQGG